MKRYFPIFRAHPNLVYLDSAATSLKPRSVIDAVSEYYSQYSTNVFRGVYPLAERATERYEAARRAAARFFGAASEKEIVFTHGATESLNLLAYSLTGDLGAPDEVAVPLSEHHSNLVLWSELARRRGFSLSFIPFEKDGSISPETIKRFVTPKTKILSLAHISNVLGAVNPVAEIVRAARKKSPGIITIVDAAQSAAHGKMTVKEFGCDFLAASSHKMLGPTGAGILWGKEDRLRALSPFLFGGEMVASVSREETVFKDIPHRLEAGTPPIASVIGLGAALQFLENIGMEAIHKHTTHLAHYAHGELLREFGGDIHILGPEAGEDRGALISFYFDDTHPHDIAQILGEKNICIRAGTHCAGPLHQALGIAATARMSFHIYNTTDDIDRAISAIKDARSTLMRYSPRKTKPTISFPASSPRTRGED